MATKRRQTLEDWVNTVIAEVYDGKGCSAITVLHLKGMGGATEEVFTKPLEGNVNAKELAAHLIFRAEGFSQDVPGLQTFKLSAFYGSNEPRNPFHLTISDGSVISRQDAMMTANEPTPAGLLGQLMKHNEAIMRENAGLVAQGVGMANGVIGMFLGPQGVMQGSIRSQLEAIEVVKDAMLDMSDKRRAIISEEAKAAQSLQINKAIIDIIPHFANKLTGREFFDVNKNRAKVLESLAENIKPEDIELLVGLGKITSEQALGLTTVFAEIQAEKKLELEALKKVPSEEGENKIVVSPNGKGNAL